MSKTKPFKRRTGSGLGLKTSSGHHSLPCCDKVDFCLCEGHDHLVKERFLYLTARWVSNQSSEESNIWHGIEIRHSLSCRDQCRSAANEAVGKFNSIHVSVSPSNVSSPPSITPPTSLALITWQLEDFSSPSEWHWIHMLEFTGSLLEHSGVKF